MSGKSRKIAVCGLLGALALALTLLEGMLPPIPGLPPGARPGLSNIVTMFAAGSLGLPYALAIALIKGVFAFLTRGVTAGLMSLSLHRGFPHRPRRTVLYPRDAAALHRLRPLHRPCAAPAPAAARKTAFDRINAESLRRPIGPAKAFSFCIFIIEFPARPP